MTSSTPSSASPRLLDPDRIRAEQARRGRVWRPLPGPQTLAYDSPADVLGYGGAAGGGKTDLLLGLALTRHLRSAIFRREAVEGRGLADRARELLGGLGRLNEATGVWRGIPGGRQLELAGVKDPGDELKWRGRAHDYVGFDEADRFSEFQVRFLQGWLRTTTPAQRCRVVLTFNPPAEAQGRWLLSYFGPWIDRRHPRPAAPGELRWYATTPDGVEAERPDGAPFEADGPRGPETVRPRSRTFVPARVQDNPHLMATGYVATLQALPEPLRSQVLHGDFTAGVEDDPWQVVPTAWAEAAVARWTPAPPAGSRLDAVGVDVARGGRDKTVLAPRWGPWLGPLEKHPGAGTPDGPAVVRLVAAALAPNPHGAAAGIDVIGVGSSPYDWGRASGLPVVPVDFRRATAARSADGRLAFVNVRAQAWWGMREALDPASGAGLMLPPDRELLADLTAPRWRLTPRGVQIEAKEDVVRRTGRSPDCGDAAVLALLTSPALWLPDADAARSAIDAAPEGVFHPGPGLSPDEGPAW